MDQKNYRNNNHSGSNKPPYHQNKTNRYGNRNNQSSNFQNSGSSSYQPKNKQWNKSKPNYNTRRSDMIKPEHLKANGLKELIEHAENLVEQDIKRASPTSIRRIYNPIVKIKALLNANNKDKWERELLLLKPRITYLSARDHKIKALKEDIIQSIDHIEKLENDKTKKQAVENFCHFMEAVVAYHKEKHK